MYAIKISAAKMPSKCWGRYQRIAVMEVEPWYDDGPISERTDGVIRVIQTWEKCHVGKTARSAVAKALAAAEALVVELESAGALARDAFDARLEARGLGIVDPMTLCLLRRAFPRHVWPHAYCEGRRYDCAPDFLLGVLGEYQSVPALREVSLTDYLTTCIELHDAALEGTK